MVKFIALFITIFSLSIMPMIADEGTLPVVVNPNPPSPNPPNPNRPRTPDLEVEIDCWYQAGCVVASFSDDAGYVDVAVTLNGSTIVSTSVPTAAPAQIYVGTAPGVYQITFTIANQPYTGTWAL